MKKFLQIIALFLILAFSGIVFFSPKFLGKNFFEISDIGKPCSKPIKYSIGSVDSRFQIDEEKLLENARQAEKVWEDPIGKNLFVYNPDSEIKINLIFDERQQKTIEAEKLENKLEILESDRTSALKEYNSLNGVYQEKIKKYNKTLKSYEKRLEEYEDEVNYWKKLGGAPEDEYEKLKKEKDALDEIFKKLEKERASITLLVEKTNQAIKKENEIVGKYNLNIETYKNKFGASREFEKGVYDGTNINIYEFRENSDLTMTLIHEFGHALGIGHLNNSDSIMYYLIGEQDLENPKLTQEDLSAIENICEIK